MKHYLRPVFVLTAIAILACSPALAESGEKMVIALATDDFELAETDISALAIGEAKTIETASGKVIDILRTADGAEIYVDGELLEMDFNNEDGHEDHAIDKHVEVICDEDGECEKNVVILTGDERESLHWEAADGENIVIHKEVEIICSDGEAGGSCGDHALWVSDSEDIDVEKSTGDHESGEGHKFIVIKKKHVTKD